MDQTKFGRAYETDFDPVSYLNTFYAVVGGCQNGGELIPFKLSSYHEVATQIPPFETLLDLGCGPCIDSHISLSCKCSKIFMAEYAAANRKEVEKWILQSPDAHDWSAFFKFAAEKEGIDDPRQIEDRVRQKIQLPILTFSAVEGDIIGRENNQTDAIPTNFDMVVTSFCLEAAAANLTEYESALCRVSKLIKAGGYFLMVGVLDETFYTFNNVRFYCLKLNEDEIRQSLGVAGFVIQKWMAHDRSVTVPESVSDFAGAFAVLCRKR